MINRINTLQRLVLIINCILISATTVYSSTQVLDYGFEDWNGNAETTPGYIFRINVESVWQRQLDASEVVEDCEGRKAHSGRYYFRLRMDQSIDPCLGTTVTHENSYIRFGNGDAAFPFNSGDKTDLRSAITGEVMTLRFWFRLTGHWPPTGVSGNPMSKFVRICFGDADYESDDRCGHLQFHANATQFAIFDRGTMTTSYFPIDDIDDGEWHSLSVVSTRLNNSVHNPNYRMQFWLDDYDMEGKVTGEKDLHVQTPGVKPFRLVALFVNYGGVEPNPTQEHAIEYDDFEIWDGIPEKQSEGPLPPKLYPPVDS